MWRGERSCKTTWIPRAAVECRLRKYHRRRGATRFLRPYNHNNSNNNSHNVVIIIYVYCTLYAIRVHSAHNNEYNNNNIVRRVYYYYYYYIKPNSQPSPSFEETIMYRHGRGRRGIFGDGLFRKNVAGEWSFFCVGTAQCLEHATSTSSQIAFSA